MIVQDWVTVFCKPSFIARLCRDAKSFARINVGHKQYARPWLVGYAARTL